VLIDGSRILHDSWDIALYLESTYAHAPSLFGATAAVPPTRLINAWADSALHAAIGPMIALDVYDHLHPADQPYFRTTREARYGVSLEALAADGALYRRQFTRALEPLRTVLATQRWLAGDAPGYADYVIAGTLQWPRAFVGDALLDAADPVRGWFDAVLDLHGQFGRSLKLARDAT
jgi:glutathione S-transferase